jgi:hypothetical protein
LKIKTKGSTSPKKIKTRKQIFAHIKSGLNVRYAYSLGDRNHQNKEWRT